MKKSRMYWIMWKLWDAALLIYIRACTFRNFKRERIEHRWRMSGRRHAARLKYLSDKTDKWFYKWFNS